MADVALGYVIGLARHTFEIDRGVRSGEWPKFQGISLAGRTAAILGLGDIGSNLARRLNVLGMRAIAYDPQSPSLNGLEAVDLVLRYRNQIRTLRFHADEMTQQALAEIKVMPDAELRQAYNTRDIEPD